MQIELIEHKKTVAVASWLASAGAAISTMCDRIYVGRNRKKIDKLVYFFLVFSVRFSALHRYSFHCSGNWLWVNQMSNALMLFPQPKLKFKLDLINSMIEEKNIINSIT